MSKWFPVLFDRKFPSKYAVSEYGEVKDITTGEIIPQIADDDVGMYVILYRSKVVNKTFTSSTEYDRGTKFPVDLLVANAFVPRTNKSLAKVFHMDGDRLNNYYKNLSWISPKSFKNPVKHSVTKDQILCICNDLCEGKLKDLDAIAEKNFVKRSYVSDIFYRRRHADETKDFVFNPKYCDNSFIVSFALEAFLSCKDYHNDPTYVRFDQSDKDRFKFAYKWIENNIEDVIKEEKRRIKKCGGKL